MIYAQSGDLFFTSGEGWLANAIQWAEQIEGEAETEVNHTGAVIHGGWMVPPISQAIAPEERLQYAQVSEALWHVKKWQWYQNHKDQENYTVEVWRHNLLTIEEIDRAVQYWTKQTGQRYGWWKLGAHLVDNKIFRGARIFRRLLGKVERRPICSFHAARGYSLIGVDFGGPANEATPDSMHDWVKEQPQWRMVGKETLNAG
jgi:hypothetical protein